MHLAGRDGERRRRPAAIGNVLHFDAGPRAPHLKQQVRLGGRAGGPVVELARLGLGERDEFRQRARRHLGVDRKQQRVLDQDGDRLEIALRSKASFGFSAALTVNVVGTISSV